MEVMMVIMPYSYFTFNHWPGWFTILSLLFFKADKQELALIQHIH